MTNISKSNYFFSICTHLKKKNPCLKLAVIFCTYLRYILWLYILENWLRHFQLWWRYIINVYFIICQEACKRMCSAAMFQITHKCYLRNIQKIRQTRSIVEIFETKKKLNTEVNIQGWEKKITNNKKSLNY